MTTYCDVNTCEDCPRYGDDCDGDKRVEHTDYISRADAIEALSRSSVYAWSTEQDLVAHSWAIRILQSLPSADAVCREDTVTLNSPISIQAVHGEWEDREVFNETDDDHIVEEWQSARCSVCGKYHTTPYMYYFDDFNYCPNCGARMKGGGDE